MVTDMAELMNRKDKISKSIDNKVHFHFGDWLVKEGHLTYQQLCEAISEERQSGLRLSEILVKMNLMTDKQVTSYLSSYLNIDALNLEEDVTVIDMKLARLIPETIAKRFSLIAIKEEQGQVIVAMADPLNVVALDTVGLKLKRPIKPIIASASQISSAIEIIYHGSDVEEQRLRELVSTDQSKRASDDISLYSEDEDDQLSTDIQNVAYASDAPVIRFVDLLLSQAVKSKASDIHVEPQERSMNIRMRIDGILREMVPPSRNMQPAVIARLKILSKMDIAERRLPQDGRFKIKATGRDIDVRVSSIPTIYGEKIVMRILDKTAVNHNLDQLGFEPKLLNVFKSMLKRPHGIVIVTGPTGSGKSTTLYSALNFIKDPGKNITTVEDPVEYRLDGINQIQIKPEINLDFAISLRSILRQDPDIILIGEIRDKETMEIAIKASLTGHLVLSTFHTNDAPSAISRLVYMGLPSYLLATTLNLVVAQRLVRRICENCKEPTTLDQETFKRLGLDPAQYQNTTFYRGKGCKSCSGTGFKGRLPIFEFLPIDDEIRDLITVNSTESTIREAAIKKGFGTLLENGILRILDGSTTPEEVLGVTFTTNID